MEFWGTEVKVGETVKVDPEEYDAYVHLSQAALGESKKDKANEPVVLHLKVGEQKLVLGTLSKDKIPQTSLDVVLDQEFELSHNSKSASVFFCGYKALIPDEEGDEDDFDSDEDLPLPAEENGKSVTKAEEPKAAEPKKADAKVAVPAKQVKIADPKKDEKNVEDEDDDDSDDDDDDSDDFGSSDDELDDADSDSDHEDDSEDDVETPPKKVELGKKRANDSASKTPVSNKKAKNATPEKTDGKKGGHVATPHPAKKGGQSPGSNNKGQSPKSGGQSSGQSGRGGFKKPFNNSGGGRQQPFNNSGGGRQQHNKGKHGK